ncbi:AAA family ATPase, partial [Pseudomonas chlororaphis]
MRLNNFRISGFKSKTRNAEVTFSNGNVTVIFGDNGCGKTTFLKAINSFLSQDDAALAAMEIDAISCAVTEGDISRTIIIKKEEGGYNWGDFESCFLGNS